MKKYLAIINEWGTPTITLIRVDIHSCKTCWAFTFMLFGLGFRINHQFLL